MHELSLCQSILGIVDRARAGRTVEAVELKIGQMRQVVPETLVFCWGLVTESTGLDGSWPVHYYWYSLVNGGRTGTFVLVIPHANWADFEDKPDMKPFPEMLKDAFGQADADALMKKFDDATESETTEINEFRADLSYFPAH